MQPDFFRRRLESLGRRQCRVLPLGDGLRRLREGSLPPRSVVLTFDDGFHDFYQCAFPLLLEFGFPATIYQTTYYSNFEFPIFNLILSYLFWRANGRQINSADYDLDGPFDLSSPFGRKRAVNAFLKTARERKYDPGQKNELAAALACNLGVDYGEIMRLRMLQLMTAPEIGAVRAAGIDVQLHTHRHQTPLEESLFVREIRDNRAWLASYTGASPDHFCYPSGVHHPEFLPWLRNEGVLSATTCDSGFATRTCEPLLLPRLVDSIHVTEVAFEGWLCGASALLPHRKVQGSPETLDPVVRRRDTEVVIDDDPTGAC